MHKGKNKKAFEGSYDSIISIENLLLAWREFVRGKKQKTDVQEFEYRLIEKLTSLHVQLKSKTYRHGAYEAFKINDPKPRDIHKASVLDRVLHHALYRTLSPFFCPLFIADSYSCQLGKGTHKALERFTKFANIVSQNNTKQCFVLKCDVKKFFASIDHVVLSEILKTRIIDKDVLRLLQNIIDSIDSGVAGKGLPLGNLTSQLLVNIYMHEFDVYMKQTLKVKYYIRYADDFVVFARDEKYLKEVLHCQRQFLEEKLALRLHPHKVSIETLASGVDFLGWVHFPHKRTLRTVTKRRMLRKLRKDPDNQSILQSYEGLLGHGNTHKLRTCYTVKLL
jgi:retron-type reverse transcriptase